MNAHKLLLCSCWLWQALAFSRISSIPARTMHRQYHVQPLQRNDQPLSVVRESISPWQRTTSILTRPETVKSCALMTLISAPLGMMLDNQHGLFGVLEYATLGVPIQLYWSGHAILKTALWVPFLFGVAGMIMSAIIFVLDEVLNTPIAKRVPSWPQVWYGISLFSFQYWTSGLLDFMRVDSLTTHAILSISAVLGFLYFDSTIAGLLLAIATAVAGPLAEIVLINIPHLYVYTHADLWGICSWIPWVYFLGAPAVGNLARKVLVMQRKDDDEQQ